MNLCGKHLDRLGTILGNYDLEVALVAENAVIPGSYWGEPEAGLRGSTLFVRADTPLHSALHEACHFICMDNARRKVLDTDAGGEYLEESAVCYLQILLADLFDEVGAATLCAEMDAWGYSFRLGSTTAWFADDAEDARSWLVRAGIIDENNRPTGELRGAIDASGKD